MESAEVRKYYNRFWIALLGGYTAHVLGNALHSDGTRILGLLMLAISFPLFLKAWTVHRIYKDELIREQARMAARRHLA